MPAVFHNEEDILTVGADWVSRLKTEADLAPRRRARLCMHQSAEDSVQEMLIAFCRDALVRPHRSLDKTESIHVVDGELRMIIFDDQGSVIQRFDMGPVSSGKTFVTRLSASPWYAYLPLTDFVVMLETTRGPFDASGAAFPEWAPEDGAELRDFLQQAGDQ